MIELLIRIDSRGDNQFEMNQIRSKRKLDLDDAFIEAYLRSYDVIMSLTPLHLRLSIAGKKRVQANLSFKHLLAV